MSLISQLVIAINKLEPKVKRGEPEVEHFLLDAPKKYKVYKIPKRKHGHRIIAQPSKELKTYQKAFLSLVKLPVHDCAMAYRKNLSIKDNAMVHHKQCYLLKMDFEHFFNSITPKIFWQVCQQINLQYSLAEKQIIEKLLFWCPSKKADGKLVLSVGAPSSPYISNFCLFFFDQALNQHCTKLGVRYTRYADDLTFSTNHKQILFDWPGLIQKLLYQQFGHQLRINHGKTVFASKASNRHVTGVTITNQGKLSLGRERKRYIKHLVHQFKFDKLNLQDSAYLHGLLAFAQHIEPDFIKTLTDKYSPTVIQAIIKANYNEKA